MGRRVQEQGRSWWWSPNSRYPHAEIHPAHTCGGRCGRPIFWDFWTPTMDSLSFHGAVPVLKCGDRVAAVGGTGKDAAGSRSANVRHLRQHGDDELSFDSWHGRSWLAKDLTPQRSICALSVEGRQPGDEPVPASAGPSTRGRGNLADRAGQLAGDRAEGGCGRGGGRSGPAP